MPDVDVDQTLELAREGLSPSAHELDRISQFVKVLVQRPAATNEARHPDASTPIHSRPWQALRLSGRAGYSLLGGAVAVGVLMGYLLRMWQVPSIENPIVPEERAPTTDVPGAAPSSKPDPVERSAVVEPARAERAAADLASRGQPSAKRSGSRAPTPRKAPGAPPRSPSALPQSWDGELALLQRAEWAIRQGESGLALAISRQLEADIPVGAFREEREAVRVMAECQAGIPRAGANAARYIRDRPSSAYVDRVREYCGAERPIQPSQAARR